MMIKGLTNKRSIVLFWALFLVPTFLVAGIAFKLLSHEQERINTSALRVFSERAKIISETIHFTVETVQENLTRSLMMIDPAQLQSRLLEWEKTNPLVRNIFIYRKDKGLDYPVKGMASTFEERQFIVRYDAFFSGRTAFDFDKNPSTAESMTNRSASPASDTKKSGDDSLKKLSQPSRQALVDLSRVEPRDMPSLSQAGSSAGTGSLTFKKSGWIPWFSENRLYLLGWVQGAEKGLTYGIELEWMTLLSRLVVDFPELPQDGVALVLMDGNKNFMHQSGNWAADPTDTPAAAVSISNRLPHWQLAVFIDDKGVAATRGFLYISIILLGIFVVAIVSGGILLTRLAFQTMKDARQKTSFVSSVSHELKTPLTSIRMYAELLKSKRIKDESKVQTYLSVIVSESGRLTRLINNVLDFGKLEQGKKSYQYKVFELDRFLSKIIAAHRIRIRNQGLEIITQWGTGPYTVRTDPDALDQVVLNLIDNALKYAGSGAFIKFVLKHSDGGILLSICDDGPGISKTQQDRIFEKFYRGDNSLTADQPGSGLGLSIARQILRDLDGDLCLDPISENGSCFTARIKSHGTD